MLKGKVSVSSKVDKRKELVNAIKKASGIQVYVGIPQGDEGDHGDITNAELMYVLTHGVRAKSMREDMQPNLDSGMDYSRAYELYIHSNGSPLWYVPPRPILEPAIENSKEMIAGQLKKAANVVLDGRDPTSELQKAGMLGQNVARDWFTNPNNNWPKNAPSTIDQKGSDKPNLDTGELRKSITYVVKKND